MTTKPLTPIEISESRIEQLVKVYLVWDSATQSWMVDPLMRQEHREPLDSNYDGIDIDLHPENWTDAIRAEVKAANQTARPTAEELFLLLWKSLPADSPVREALSKVTEAASNWSNELTGEISKYSPEDEAQEQRDAGQAIDDAVALLEG